MDSRLALQVGILGVKQDSDQIWIQQKSHIWSQPPEEDGPKPEILDPGIPGISAPLHHMYLSEP